MPAYYTLATPETVELCKAIVMLCHTDLDSTAAKIDILMAFRDPEGEEPAMVNKGHRLLTKSNVIKLKDRVKGMGDCEILLDGDIWEDLPTDRKRAIIDHALEHFEVKRDSHGEFVYDDLQRPEIKIRNYDRQFSFFDKVASRHRAASIEVNQLKRLFAESEQVYLPYITDEGREE
jgi:hypothetical protein